MPRTDVQTTGRPIRYTKAGRVLVSGGHMLLVEVLAELPGRQATSYKSWIQGAISHCFLRWGGRPSFWNLLRSVRSMPDAFVKKEKVGTRIRCTLTEAGIGALNGEVPVHIIGFGPYVPEGQFAVN